LEHESVTLIITKIEQYAFKLSLERFRRHSYFQKLLRNTKLVVNRRYC